MTRRILIVDDDALLLKGLKRALFDESFTIDTETDPMTALTRVESGEFDVIISDHDMPGMNGATFLTEVRKLDATIIRFMLTGKATLDMAVAAINEGTVDRFFTKPCDHNDLATTIRSALDHRELLAESRQLLWLYRRQAAQLAEFEESFPNLSDVDRDESGLILLEDLPTDAEGLRKLMAEIFESDQNAA